MGKNICQNCQSDNIETAVSIGLSAESGAIGPRYSANFFMVNVAAMCCDICKNCGEITRFYIKDKTDKKWIKKSV